MSESLSGEVELLLIAMDQLLFIQGAFSSLTILLQALLLIDACFTDFNSKFPYYK